MKCPNAHRLCTSGTPEDCAKYGCRAFFPEKQPIIMPEMLASLCHTEEYIDCPQFNEGEKWKAERKAKWIAEHCRFASNAICGKPKDWWCKGSSYPFKLYPPEDAEKDEEVRETLKVTCWTGDTEIHEECPHYKAGVALREYVKKEKVNQLKKKQ